MHAVVRRILSEPGTAHYSIALEKTLSQISENANIALVENPSEKAAILELLLSVSD